MVVSLMIVSAVALTVSVGAFAMGAGSLGIVGGIVALAAVAAGSALAADPSTTIRR